MGQEKRLLGFEMRYSKQREGEEMMTRQRERKKMQEREREKERKKEKKEKEKKEKGKGKIKGQALLRQIWRVRHFSDRDEMRSL